MTSPYMITEFTKKSPEPSKHGRKEDFFTASGRKKVASRQTGPIFNLVSCWPKQIETRRKTLSTEGKVYFISDAHLGEDNPEVEKSKEERLIAFLRHIARDAAYLYVVGDLFDFWFEYKQAVPARHHRVLHQLAALVQQGTRAVYVAGNHDFWLGDFLSQEIGMEVSGRPLAVAHHGLRLFVAHGDGLASKDRGYRLLKKILRHPVNIWLYRQIHPDIGLPLGKLISASSRAYTDQKALKMVMDYERAARQKLAQDFDAVILGHSHYPILRHFGDKTYLNIGDWITHFTYGMLQEGKLTLENWKQNP